MACIEGVESLIQTYIHPPSPSSNISLHHQHQQHHQHHRPSPVRLPPFAPAISRFRAFRTLKLTHSFYITYLLDGSQSHSPPILSTICVTPTSSLSWHLPPWPSVPLSRPSVEPPRVMVLPRGTSKLELRPQSQCMETQVTKPLRLQVRLAMERAVGFELSGTGIWNSMLTMLARCSIWGRSWRWWWRRWWRWSWTQRQRRSWCRWRC